MQQAAKRQKHSKHREASATRESDAEGSDSELGRGFAPVRCAISAHLLCTCCSGMLRPYVATVAPPAGSGVAPVSPHLPSLGDDEGGVAPEQGRSGLADLQSGIRAGRLARRVSGGQHTGRALLLFFVLSTPGGLRPARGGRRERRAEGRGEEGRGQEGARAWMRFGAPVDSILEAVLTVSPAASAPAASAPTASAVCSTAQRVFGASSGAHRRAGSGTGRCGGPFGHGEVAEEGMLQMSCRYRKQSRSKRRSEPAGVHINGSTAARRHRQRRSEAPCRGAARARSGAPGCAWVLARVWRSRLSARTPPPPARCAARFGPAAPAPPPAPRLSAPPRGSPGRTAPWSPRGRRSAGGGRRRRGGSRLRRRREAGGSGVERKASGDGALLRLCPEGVCSSHRAALLVRCSCTAALCCAACARLIAPRAYRLHFEHAEAFGEGVVGREDSLEKLRTRGHTRTHTGTDAVTRRHSESASLSAAEARRESSAIKGKIKRTRNTSRESRPFDQLVNPTMSEKST